MGIRPKDLRRLIQNTLEPIGWWTQDVEELLILTAAAESNMGEYLYQAPGPARGIFQMEPATEKDIWENYLKFKPYITAHFEGVQRDLAGNLIYQIMIARVHYMRDKGSIPKAEQPMEIAKYYKRVWNTIAGKGSAEVAYAKYLKYQ